MKSAFYITITLLTSWCSHKTLPNSGNNDTCSYIQQDLSDCIPESSSYNLEIMTWNIENFPKDSSTVCRVRRIIDSLQVDIIAVQEIDSNVAFDTLVSGIKGWKAVYFDVRGGIETGYLYKESEIVAVEPLKSIFPENRQEFPREPVLLTAKHKNGLEVTIVNVHLKCCKDGEERRRNASLMLKQYLDDSLKTENVIVLGDFNDDILAGSPFENFTNDSTNYTFADRQIALGGEENWSYPSWPAHIDHIIISDELNDNLINTSTLALDKCIEPYDKYISDHRPVVISLKKDIEKE